MLLGEPIRTMVATLAAGVLMQSAAFTSFQAPSSTSQSVVLEGRVLAAGGNEGIEDATVIASGDLGRHRTATAVTRADGTFRLELPAGKYMIWATKKDFTGGYYGQRTPALDEAPTLVDVPLSTGSRIVLQLWGSAIISGVVANWPGNVPLGKVAVLAYERTFLAGHQQWHVAPNGVTRTDDRGEYRFSELVAGSYVICVKGVASADMAVPICAPGVTLLDDANVVNAESGGSRMGVDIVIPRVEGLRGAHISGTVAERKHQVDLRVVGVDATGQPESPEQVVVSTAEDGSFRTPFLPEGSYRIALAEFPPVPKSAPGVVAQFGNGRAIVGRSVFGGPPLAPISTDPTWVASTVVNITGKDVNGVLLTPVPAGRIRGKLLFDSDKPPASDLLMSSPVRVLAADGRDVGRFQIGGVTPDGQFQTIGLPPGKYLIDVGLPDWHFVSASAGGHVLAGDVIAVESGDVSVEIHFAPGPMPTLSGTIRDGSGAPRSDAAVYVFPVEKAAWTDFGPFPARLAVVRSVRSGLYSVSLPPGDYYVAATFAELPHDWMSESVLKGLVASGVSVKLTADATVDLVVR